MENFLDAGGTSVICQIFEILCYTTCILIMALEFYFRAFILYMILYFPINGNAEYRMEKIILLN